MSAITTPRGKDLRWAPGSVLRDARMAWSAFRNTKVMLELMDEEFIEERADEAKMLAEHMDHDFERLSELLTNSIGEQNAKRKEQETKEG